MEGINVKLISGRTTRQGVGLEIGKTSDDYFKSVSYIEISNIDAGKIGLNEEDIVSVKTRYGSINVFSRFSDDLESGIAFIPYGPWANRLFGSSTDGTGMPSFKGITAEIQKAIEENVPTLDELVEVLKGV